MTKVAAAVDWHQRATRVPGNQDFPLKPLQTYPWGFYFTLLGAFCAATWRAMKKTVGKLACKLTGMEMAYLEVKA